MTRHPVRAAVTSLRPRTRFGRVALGGYLPSVLCGLGSLLLVTPDDPSLVALLQLVALPPWAGPVEAATGAVFALPHTLLESMTGGSAGGPAREAVLVVGSLGLAAAELATTVLVLAVLHVALVTAVARRPGRRSGERPAPGVMS